MAKKHLEQQLNALLVVSGMLGVAMLTVALFAMQQSHISPYLPFALSSSGMLLLVTSGLIGLILKCLHR